MQMCKYANVLMTETFFEFEVVKRTAKFPQFYFLLISNLPSAHWHICTFAHSFLTYLYGFRYLFSIRFRRFLLLFELFLVGKVHEGGKMVGTVLGHPAHLHQPEIIGAENIVEREPKEPVVCGESTVKPATAAGIQQSACF